MEQQVSDYYLKIQALTPQTNQEVPAQLAPELSSGSNLLMPFVVFILIFIMGLAVVVVLRIKDLRRITSLMTMALIAASIPLALVAIQSSTQTRSKANQDTTPKNFTVQTQPSTIILTWETSTSIESIVQIAKDLQFTHQIQQAKEPSTTNHNIVIKSLQPQADYYLRILSDGTWYQDESGPIKVTIP